MLLIKLHWRGANSKGCWTSLLLDAFTKQFLMTQFMLINFSEVDLNNSGLDWGGWGGEWDDLLWAAPGRAPGGSRWRASPHTSGPPGSPGLTQRWPHRWAVSYWLSGCVRKKLGLWIQFVRHQIAGSVFLFIFKWCLWCGLIGASHLSVSKFHPFL